ncbi:GumC family protein [Pontibaca salina]|uniref:AAA family ATPase n=1 Tax=Pontibaca salina TaxID=2795731 RepID=A0A934M101_9RHOB|nr:polysaccharide biosynthesis tyrosine autokinase [Pontibaca salina]MBI6630268.1 AAA family ATPase [Pontibaca salina]
MYTGPLVVNEPERRPEFDRDPEYFQSESDFIDLRKIVSVIWRGKLFVLFAGLIGFIIGSFLVSREEPIYIATANVLFEPERLQIVDSANATVGRQDLSNEIGNQIAILTSTTLLSRVAKNLDAADRGQSTNSQAPEVERPTAEEESAARRYREAVSILRKNLMVSQVIGSRVIEITYASTDADHAASVTNAIVDEFLRFQTASKNQDVAAAIDLMDQRIADFRERIARSEDALAQARLDLVERQTQSSEMTRTQLTVLSEELARVRIDLAGARSRYERSARALAADNVWRVPEFRESPLIQTLRERELEVREMIASESQTVSPNRTKNISTLEEIRDIIREEAGYIVEALKFNIDSLEQREQQLVEAMRELEVVAINQATDELYISGLEREVQGNQAIYQSYTTRQKEISEEAKLGSTDLRVLSRAEPPASPDRLASNRLLAATSASGLLLGMIILLLRERLSNALRSSQELYEATSLPILASVPVVGRRRETGKLVKNFVNRPDSILAESIRNLRTSILYGDPENQPKVIMFTSSVVGEGKSAISFLVGLASQKTERKTILVNCDMRNRKHANLYSTYKKLDQSSGGAGLGALLRGECTLEEALFVESGSGLHLLTLSQAENLSESPADLLSSDRFAEIINLLREKYDLVILDTPAALAVTDARLVARLADTVVYLVRWNKTSRNAVKEGLRRLRSVDAHISGCAFSLVYQSKARKYADNELIYQHGYAGVYRQ